MKKLYSLALLCFLTLTSSLALAVNANNLVVFSQDGYKFTLIVNGLKQNEKPETNVKVVGLNASNYKVRVLFEDAKMAPIDQTVYLMDGGVEVTNKEFSYAVEMGKKGLKLKPQSIADITGPSTTTAAQSVYQYNPSGSTMIGTSTTVTTVTSGTSTTSTSDPNNVTMGTTISDGAGGTTSTTTTTTTTGEGASVGVNAGGVGISINITDGMGGTSSSTTTTTTTSSSTTTSAGTSTSQGEVVSNNANNCIWPMNSNDFAKAKASVQAQSFEDGKLKVAKQILNSNCLSTAQVKEIMGLFSFEETKLDWAKFAYGKTTDPNNYYQINDGFTFSTSTDELDAYIKAHPHQ